MQEIQPLSDWVAANRDKNPVALGYDVKQLRIDGVLRFGLRIPVAVHGRGALAANISGDLGATSDVPSEYELLMGFARASKGAAPRDSGMERARGAAEESADGCGSHGEDDEGSELGNDSDDDEFAKKMRDLPKCRETTAIKKHEQRVRALLLNLTSESWRMGLKETGLRSTLRSCGGLKLTLQRSEHPECITMNEGHCSVINDLSEIQKAVVVLSREVNASSLAEVGRLVDKVSEHLAARASNPISDELLVLRVPEAGR
jgi:hypothetical protein